MGMKGNSRKHAEGSTKGQPRMRWIIYLFIIKGFSGLSIYLNHLGLALQG